MASIFYGWWIVVAGFMIAFYVGGVLFYGFTAFFEPIVEEFGWSHTQVSIAFSLRGLEMGILAPLVGFLVDRFGPRKLVFFGILVAGFALVVLSLTRSLSMFYGAFVLLALGTSCCSSTVLMTTAALWFRKNVGKAMGLLVCGFGAGGILIPVIVWLIDLYDWRTTLIILGLGMWAMGVPLSFIIRDRPEKYGHALDGEVSTESASREANQNPEKETPFREAIRSRNFWRLGTANAIRLMVAMAIITHVMPYLGSIGMSQSKAALIATFIPLFSIIGRFGFGWLGDIYDKRFVMAGLYALFGIGTLLFAFLHANWLILLFLLVLPPALGGTVSLRGAILREYFGRRSFGKLFGIVIGMAAIGAVIGPSVAGWTYDTLGTYHSVWICFAGVMVVAMVLTLQLEAPGHRVGGINQSG